VAESPPAAGAWNMRDGDARARARGSFARVSTHGRVKKLAAELSAYGIQSEYIARVEARVSREQSLEDIQKEITQEIAGALGRSDMRVNLALAELELHKARYEHGLREGLGKSELRALAEAFNEQRKQAQARLRELQIHREAIGFRRNQILNELYPIAAKIPLPDDDAQ
jgi:HAMP domain-containing protein